MNKIKCLKCGQTIHSKHRHDFVVCSCWDNEGNGCAADGGDDYKRRLGGNYEEVYDLRDLVTEFLSILEETEESDSGTTFHPVTINSCRVMKTKRIGELLISMKNEISGLEGVE